MKVQWIKQEPGWYTSDYGAVVHELDGWWAYPIGICDEPDASIGPFGSMKAAKAAMFDEDT